MAPSQRRRSIDSSSSSSPGTCGQSKSDDDKQMSEPLKGGSGRNTSGDAQSSFPRDLTEPPPSYTVPVVVPQVPPSGYRVPLSFPGPPLPGVERTREAPFTDIDGKTPVFIGSALMQYSVHPCKIVGTHQRPCYVSYGGGELAHEGRFDLLPFVPEHMEFVQTSHGLVPPGRRPVKGGFENDGTELYHAAAMIDGVKVPGKTGTHLRGCNIPYNGKERVVVENYEILCWRF